MSADRPDRRRLGALIGLLEARGLWRGLVPGGGAAPAAVEIRAIAYDSRRVRPGDLFVALPGTAAEGHPFVDGHDFLADAIARGAVALVVERPEPGLHVPQVIVSAGRPALAVAAAWHAGFPSQRLGIVGVTGTDGKTTTCHLVRAILEASDRPTGLLGTVDVVVGGRARGNPERTTTPEAPELQGLLAEMEAAGDRWAVVESSSHGLALDRVADVAYDVAVVTNVTLDHLELHRTLAAYRAAKLSLFARLALGPSNPDKGFGKHGVVNLDDPLAAAFDEAARTAGAEVVTYGAAAEADVRLVRLEEDVRRLRLRVRMPGWNGSIGLPMAGRFNAHNALAALAVGQALGLDGEACAAALDGHRLDPEIAYLHAVLLAQAGEHSAAAAAARGAQA
jgi:UDP-N-acetylmuramyl-tripeptide synthetase